MLGTRSLSPSALHSTPAEAVTVHRKSVPPNVAAAVAKSLEKLPADRFESAKAFSEALANHAYSSATVSGAAPTSVLAPHQRVRDAVLVGQAEIEHDRSIAHGRQHVRGIGGGAHRIGGKAAVDEAFFQQGDEFGVVLDEKHPHGRAPPIRLANCASILARSLRHGPVRLT